MSAKPKASATGKKKAPKSPKAKKVKAAAGPQVNASADFEAGILFNKYASNAFKVFFVCILTFVNYLGLINWGMEQ